MKAVRVHQTGSADVLRYDEVPIPEPGPGTALVKVEAAGLNFIDIYQRMGAYTLGTPFTLGMEGAGVVAAVGSGVAELRPGDRVAWAMQQGAYAEYVVVPAPRLVPVPAAIDLRQAAAVMLQGLTAHYLCKNTYPVEPGDYTLVHAAAGGVGLLLVQLIAQAGGIVIATAGTAEKAELAKRAGAHEVIIYTQDDFEREVKRITEDALVDVVYDSVGKDTFDKSLNCIKPRGYMVLYGQASGAVAPFNPQILNQKGSLFLTRPSLGPYIATRDELFQRSQDLFGWMQAGKLDVRIDQSFPLEQAAAAHRYMEARQTKGKVLLIP